MRRQTTPEEQFEDLQRRKSVLEEESQYFEKPATDAGSILEDAVEAQKIRDELAETNRKLRSIEVAMKSRGVVA